MPRDTYGGCAVYLEAVEISTTDHCNLKCAQCNHASPHLPRRFTPVATIERDLAALGRAVRAGEVRIAGGEPLQHPELLELTRTVRALDIADRLVLMTNGVLLHVTDWTFLDDVDELCVSRYPGVSLKFDLRELEAACVERGVQIRVRDMKSFGKTMLTRRNASRALVGFIYRHCALVNEWSCHLVYEGRLYKCATAPFMGPRLAKVGIELDNLSDGVPLHEEGDLEQRIRDYMASKSPLSACEYCLGTMGRRIRSQQLSRQALARELEDDGVQAITVLGLRGAADSLVMPHVKRLPGYRRIRARVKSGRTP